MHIWLWTSHFCETCTTSSRPCAYQHFRLPGSSGELQLWLERIYVASNRSYRSILYSLCPWDHELLLLYSNNNTYLYYYCCTAAAAHVLIGVPKLSERVVKGDFTIFFALHQFSGCNFVRGGWSRSRYQKHMLCAFAQGNAQNFLNLPSDLNRALLSRRICSNTFV